MLSDKILIEPKSFNSSNLNKFEELNFVEKENNFNYYTKPETKTLTTTAEYQPIVTSSDFNSFRENFSKVNLDLITTMTNPKNSFSSENYINNNNNNHVNHLFQNNKTEENTNKLGCDSYYRENSQKKSNDLLNKRFSLNLY